MTIHLILLSVFLGNICCLIASLDKIRIKPDDDDVVSYTITKRAFGFTKDSTINVTLTCENDISEDEHKLNLRLCSTGTHENMDKRPCGSDKVEPKVIARNQFKYSTVINENKFYTLTLEEPNRRLDGFVKVCSVYMELINAGGRHLSLDQIPIPTNYIVTFVVWLVLSFLWLFNSLCFRRHTNKLHKLLSAILAIKLANIILAYIYWKELDNKGKIYLHASLPFVLSTSMFKTSILLLLMLAGEGWCVIWENLRLFKYYMVLSTSFFFMIICYRYVHKYFQGFAIVFASMMVYIAFKCTTISINTIKRNITASNQFIDNHRLTYKSETTLKKRLNKKLRMLNYLQGLIIGLPCILIVVESVASFLLMYNEWTKVLLEELLELSVMIYCCSLFRLRDFSDYNNISINTPYHNNVVLLTPYKNIVYISNDQNDKDEVAENDS